MAKDKFVPSPNSLLCSRVRDSSNPCILLPIMDAASLAAAVAKFLLPQLKAGSELPEPARQLWAEIAARPTLKEAAGRTGGRHRPDPGHASKRPALGRAARHHTE